MINAWERLARICGQPVALSYRLTTKSSSLSSRLGAGEGGECVNVRRSTCYEEQVTEGQLGCVRSTHGKGTCIQSFGGKSRKKETAWKNKTLRKRRYLNRRVT
jgi:hypothetical protein